MDPPSIDYIVDGALAYFKLFFPNLKNLWKLIISTPTPQPNEQDFYKLLKPISNNHNHNQKRKNNLADIYIKLQFNHLLIAKGAIKTPYDSVHLLT